MTNKQLYDRLLLDLNFLKLPVNEVVIYLRPYSKTYYGRYFPVDCEYRETPKIYLYPYEDKCGNFYPYKKILETAIHEMCHHIQLSDSSFIRLKGVMHNAQFWSLYNHYVKRAKDLKLFD